MLALRVLQDGDAYIVGFSELNGALVLRNGVQIAQVPPADFELLVASTGQVGAAASAERLCAAMEARCKDCAGVAFVLPDREFIVSGVRDWLHQIRE